MASLALATRLVVAVALLVAGLHKLRARRALRPQLTSFGVPPVAAPFVAVVLPVVEVAVGAALLAFSRSPWPAWLALALLALFTGAVAANLASGRHVPCPCFGTAVSAVSAGTLVRNGWLVALAVLATGSIAGASVAATAVAIVVLGAVTIIVLHTLG